MKKFFGLLALIVALNFSVTAANQLPSVTDNCKLLTSSEVDLLNEKIRNVQHAHKIKIGIAFVPSLNGLDIKSAAKEMLNQYFANSPNGSIVLLVDMQNHKYEIATDSRMYERINDANGIPALKNKFQPSLHNGNYVGACTNFIDGVNELVTYYETSGTTYGGSTSQEGFDPMAAVGAVVVAIFCGVMLRSMLINSMSNVHHAMEASDYLEKNSVKITENRDTFLFRNVKRRPRSGGGNGRSSGGGSSSGGGGGGSF